MPKRQVAQEGLGQAFIGTSISAEKYVRDLILDESLDDPPTDYHGSDLDDEPVTKEDSCCSNPQVPSSSGLPATAASPPKPQATKNAAYFARRNRRRSAKQLAEDTEVKQVAKKRRTESTRAPLSLDIRMEEVKVKVTAPGWIAKRTEPMPQRVFTATELIKRHGFTYFPWNGRTSHLLLDNEKRIIGVLVGQPKDEEGWKRVHRGVFEALKIAASNMTFSKKEMRHRRGKFPAVPHGISFGGGQEEPKYLNQGPEKMELLEELMSNEYVQRVCKFGSRAFETYSKRNYKYMKDTVEKLRDHYPGLRRPYDLALGVFPCRSLNLGKQSVSFPHRDEGNLVQSWCSITPFGEFDPSRGGHLVLWDFGLVIEFPAGSTVQIPSALICHSNTGIQEEETRYSMIQYAAGGLYRWVDNGFMSEQDWKACASAEEVAQRTLRQEQRWKGALEMFTQLDELLI